MCSSALWQDDRDNKAVKTKSFGENEDEDHADEDVFVGIAAHASVTDETDGEASSQGWKTDAKAGCQVLEAGGNGVGGRDGTTENDADDQSVDTEDTGHNNRDEWLVHELRLANTNEADTVTSLSSTVSGTEVYWKGNKCYQNRTSL